VPWLRSLKGDERPALRSRLVCGMCPSGVMSDLSDLLEEYAAQAAVLRCLQG